MTFNSHDTIDAITSGEDDIHKIRNFSESIFFYHEVFRHKPKFYFHVQKRFRKNFCFLCASIWEVEWIFRIQKDIHIPRKNGPAIDCAPILWFNNQNRFKNSSIELNWMSININLHCCSKLEMFFLRMSASLWELLR